MLSKCLLLLRTEIGFDDRFIILDLFRSALRELFAEIQHSDPVTELHDQRHIMFNYKDRYAPFLHLFNQIV